MVKMLEFKRIFNLCKKRYIDADMQDDSEYRSMIEIYIDAYFKKKIRECNKFPSYEQRLDHISDLVEFYNRICNENRKN